MAVLRSGPIVASCLREAGAVGSECPGRHTGSVALGTALQEVARALRDVFGREVQVLVDVGIWRRRAEAVQTDDVALLSNPALPAERRGGLDRQPCGDRRRQHPIAVALRLGREQLPGRYTHHANAA